MNPLLAEATGFAETDDPEILEVRARYAQALAKYKAETAVEAERVKAAGAFHYRDGADEPPH